MFGLAMNVFLGLTLVTEAVPGGLPEDVRLAPIRAHLEQMVQRAQAIGSHGEMIVSKVREGLAKNVSLPLIETGAARLLDGLGVVEQLLDARRQAAAPALVRALADAGAAGVPAPVLDSLMRSGAPSLAVQRAVEATTDLSLRGYPSAATSTLVRTVLSHEPQSLQRLPGSLEGLRVDYALTRAEAVDALSRSLASSDSLPAAVQETVDEKQRGCVGWSHAANHRGLGDVPGNGAWAAGRLTGRGGSVSRRPPVNR